MEDTSLLIRAPKEAEGPVCRMLLPGIENGPTELFVAVHEKPPNLAGSIAFLRHPNVFTTVRLRVVIPLRRLGIGTALLHRVVKEASNWGAKHVFAPVDGTADAGAAGFLVKRGFVRHSRLTTAEGPIEKMLASIRKTRERLASRGRLPGEARVVTFADAPREQVAELYAAHIVHNPDLQSALESRRQRDDQLANSIALMVGDRVAGILLWTMEEGVAHVHARVVRPEYQGGWVNAVMLAEGMERAWKAGARRTRFEIPGKNQDTMKLSRRFRADLLETVEQFRLDLDKENSPAKD